jgi:serpin B
MRMRAAALVAIVLVTTSCLGPGGIDVARANVPRASAAPADASLAANGVNAFGIELYRLLAGSQQNLVISPSSIALALAMARAGARGPTATEMDAVLHDVASDDHATWLNALDRALANRNGTFVDADGKDRQITLRIANAAFAQRDMALQQAYLDALAERFGSGVRLVDYANAAEQARTLINGWVDDQTEHRIPELLAPGVLDSATRLTLVNAIYLKAAWQLPFQPEATANGPFHVAGGDSVDVPFMHAILPLPYAAGSGWQAVELPYVGDELALTILLPDDLAAIRDGLDTQLVRTATDALSQTSVTLSMPKFSIESQLTLNGLLAQLGMPTAFSDAADFSGITTDEALFISDVVHQANIDVDEAGTEAAAATAVVMAGSAPVAPVAVTLDRPFLFALRDRTTGAILFLGQVTNPQAGA